MADDTLDAIGARIVSSPLAAPPLSVVWHGGEPMTLPPDWYEAAFERLAGAAPECSVRHAFQTNAVGVDDRWIALWQRWGVQIGVSVDGPELWHDARRRTRAGGGSWRLTMAGLARIREAGLPFHVITVVTADALGDADRLMDFYSAHGISQVGLNVEEEEGQGSSSSLRAREADYTRFLGRVFSRALRTEGFRLRELDGVRELAAAPREARGHNAQVSPLEIVTVGVDGAMSTYSPELIGVAAPDYDDFTFGNVREVGPEAILHHPAFRRMRVEVELGIDACRRECAHFDVCGGGAPANKFFELGTFSGTETLYCRLTRKATLSAALDALEVEAPVA